MFRSITIDTARFRCTEGLFSPDKWGKDHPGIHTLTQKAIMACSMDMRKQMCRNIYLSGGTSLLPGMHVMYCFLSTRMMRIILLPFYVLEDPV